MSNQTAITPYQQLKQMVSSDNIKARFKEILGQKTPGFLASLLNTVYLNDYLSDANPQSIITSALTAAALDLPVDPNIGMSYIIPYKIKGQKIARFQIGYKGYIQLALRSGQYTTINVVEIYQGEEVKVDRLTGKIILNGKRNGDDVIGYVAYFRLLNGFEKYLYMGKHEIEQHAKKFSKSYGEPSSVWSTNFDAMAKKTVLKMLISKYGILSIQMQTAVEHDAEPEEEPQRDLMQDNPTVIEGTFSEPEQSFNPVSTMIDEGICENEFAATGLLNKYVPEEVKLSRDTLVKWGKLYRGWRDAGAKTDEAATKASNGETPQ